MASVPTLYNSMWHYSCLWSLKGSTVVVVVVSDEKLKDALEALVAEAGIDTSRTARVVAARDTRSVSTASLTISVTVLVNCSFL